VGVEKANIIEPQPSVEEGIAEMWNIHMFLALRIYEKVGCWCNRVFLWPFQKICKLRLITRLCEHN
jgi:hypothetical protein